MRIKYIGKAPVHRDRHWGSGTVFHGPGDIQVVSDEAAAQRMVDNFPSMYREIPEKGDRAQDEDQDPPEGPSGTGAEGDETLSDEERQEKADRARILSTYLIQDGDNKVPIEDARFNALRQHVSEDLNMRMRTPDRDELEEAIISFRLTKEAVARAEGSEVEDQGPADPPEGGASEGDPDPGTGEEKPEDQGSGE